jgi:hypothetical protein
LDKPYILSLGTQGVDGLGSAKSMIPKWEEAYKFGCRAVPDDLKIPTRPSFRRD